MNVSEKIPWHCTDAIDLYGVERWGAGYFGVNDAGDVVVNAPTSKGTATVSLKDIVDGLGERGLEMPIMIRLENLVDDRIKALNQGFANAIKQAQYQGVYRGVYPIKVNQQSHVVEEIARYGDAFNHGLETGSKTELMIALATLKNRESLIICNGYKDEEFIDLGLQGVKLGFKCFFVIETPQELPIILERSEHWGVDPLIGIRLRLATKVQGHWAKDSGDRSLFGLSTTEVITLVDDLKAAGKLDCLQLLHYHLGSQIPDIRNIRNGVREACRYYIDLLQEGANLKYFDLGGGLAVDYGSTGNMDCNYTFEEYCVDVVEAIQESLNPYDIPHPVIVTESGRATVAPMSILLFNVLSVSNFDPLPCAEKPQTDCEAIANLWHTLQGVELKRLQENYNDAFYYRDLVQEAFRRGEISLRERALGENLHLLILHEIVKRVPNLKHPSDELETLNEHLSDIYYGNFSVFQSLPDTWAIGHVFPVMPIHRLNEQPTRQAVIADLTCDCDGKLDNFVGQYGNITTLPVHVVKPGQEYYLGIFLVGAYQETLGDLHNLFGDTNIASIRIREDGEIEFVHELEGDSIADVLSYVEYQPKELYRRFLALAEQAVRESRITIKERQTMLKLYNESLGGYTYFER